MRIKAHVNGSHTYYYSLAIMPNPILSGAFNPFFPKKFVTNFEKIRHFYGFYLNFSKTRQKITNPPTSGPWENIYYPKNSHKRK